MICCFLCYFQDIQNDYRRFLDYTDGKYHSDYMLRLRKHGMKFDANLEPYDEEAWVDIYPLPTYLHRYARRSKLTPHDVTKEMRFAPLPPEQLKQKALQRATKGSWMKERNSAKKRNVEVNAVVSPLWDPCKTIDEFTNFMHTIWTNVPGNLKVCRRFVWRSNN